MEEEEFVPKTLESAAHEAALADGLIPAEMTIGVSGVTGDGNLSKMKKAGLRRGKWTTEVSTLEILQILHL